MKKRQRKVRLIRAAIQLLFFIVAPSLFSTAFAGVKSIFLAIGGGQSVTWNSFLDITALLLIVTILFGRHFCGYACAFGSMGDALYELVAFIRAKCFHKKKKLGYSEELVHKLQKVKYVVLAFLLLSCGRRILLKITGNEPMGCIFHAYHRQTAEIHLSVGNNPVGTDHDRNVYTGEIFLSVSLPDGGDLCNHADPSGSTF